MRVSSATFSCVAIHPKPLNKVFESLSAHRPAFPGSLFKVTDKLAFCKGKKTPYSRVYGVIPSGETVKRLEVELAQGNKFAKIVMDPYGKVLVKFTYFVNMESPEISHKDLPDQYDLDRLCQGVWTLLENLLERRMAGRKVETLRFVHRELPGGLPKSFQIKGLHKIEYQGTSGMITSVHKELCTARIRALWITLWEHLSG